MSESDTNERFSSKGIVISPVMSIRDPRIRRRLSVVESPLNESNKNSDNELNLQKETDMPTTEPVNNPSCGAPSLIVNDTCTNNQLSPPMVAKEVGATDDPKPVCLGQNSENNFCSPQNQNHVFADFNEILRNNTMYAYQAALSTFQAANSSAYQPYYYNNYHPYQFNYSQSFSIHPTNTYGPVGMNTNIQNLPPDFDHTKPPPSFSEPSVTHRNETQEPFGKTERSRRKRNRWDADSSSPSFCPATSVEPALRTDRRSRSRDRVRMRALERGLINRKCHVSSSQTSSFVNKQLNRKMLVEKWRLSNCQNEEELGLRLEALSNMNMDELMKEEAKYWIRSAPADTYYIRDETHMSVMKGTKKLEDVCSEFAESLIQRGRNKREQLKNRIPPPPPRRPNRKCKHQCFNACSSDSSDNEDESNEESQIIEELQRKMSHPLRLHRELWYNEPGEMNDGALCKCSMKARRSGIRHGIYPGEDTDSFHCDANTNNADKLYHYRITISPPTNFLSKVPTIIEYDNHEFIFGGFSLLTHYPLPKLPVCKVIRFNIEYTILYLKEKLPENFTIRECNIFFDYLFREILELTDLDLFASDDIKDKCPPFHFMPRFERELPEEGRELLPMSVVLKYLLDNNKPLMECKELEYYHSISENDWKDFADSIKGMILTRPGSKPCSIRVDQLDRTVDNPQTEFPYPEIIHFGIRPPQLSYAGNPEYQKAWREYIKCRHLIANLSKPTQKDKDKLAVKELELQKMRTKSTLKRDVTATVSCEEFYLTGLMCDVVQHAMLIPVLVCHLRFHRSLNVLEQSIGYTFKNRGLLQLALTHPSYRENFGTNPDHARNTLSNCGIRQPQYGDRKIHFASTKKRGINTLINIMSRFGNKKETESNIYHNERLEFLGDAVVEFAATIHLFHLFRDLEEGGLATYRAALVQNQHLAILAKNLDLGDYLLYAHGSDLCHDLELKHALANCFEALMGALFLDGGIQVPDRVFGRTIFYKNADLLDLWENYPSHPLQEQEPDGDRKWIERIDALKNLTNFETITGIEFTHIRLLARAFTDRSVGYTNLTLGSNQRLEFLGDSVLQLVASEYLYKHFPEHHEGHLSLLRSSLVNNKTQSVVCDDLGMTSYATYAPTKSDLKIKDKADLLEAFLGALYVDKRSLEYIRVFCNVCFFPRLQYFIMNQEWNDPKSKLQQCCLTLRTMDGGEPDIPYYKVVECKGPTNTRSYTVAVYFRQKRLAKATGHSIQQAEMNAAQAAMDACGRLFPQLDHQKRVIALSVKTQSWEKHPSNNQRRTSVSPSSGTSRRSKSPSKKRKTNSPSRKKNPYRNRSRSPAPRKRSSSSDDKQKNYSHRKRSPPNKSLKRRNESRSPLRRNYVENSSNSSSTSSSSGSSRSSSSSSSSSESISNTE